MDRPKDYLLKKPPVALHSNGGTALDHNNRGARLHLAGKLEPAEAEYRAALESNPHYATPWNDFLKQKTGRIGEHRETKPER